MGVSSSASASWALALSLAVGGELAQFPGGPLPNQILVSVD
jgi:hypothetical protein